MYNDKGWGRLMSQQKENSKGPNKGPQRIQQRGTQQKNQ